MSTARIAFFVLQTEKAANGEYIPCIAKEGEQGYYRTNWTWGRDFEYAEILAKDKNKFLGLSEKDALLIILSTMSKSNNINRSKTEKINSLAEAMGKAIMSELERYDANH